MIHPKEAFKLICREPLQVNDLSKFRSRQISLSSIVELEEVAQLDLTMRHSWTLFTAYQLIS